MKVKKGNKVYPLITGNDIIVTKGSNSLKTVDDAIDNQQQEIDKLKSNMKYIYSYGGVGGNGSGGSGSGSSTGIEASLYISLAGHQLVNGGGTIILGEPGTYAVEGNVRNSNGETFYLKVACGTDIEYANVNQLSTVLNQCKYNSTFNLKTNGEVVVEFYDSDYNKISTIRQYYIVNPHEFNMKFMYKFNNGASEAEFSKTNEYFIGDINKTNPFIHASFKIDIPNVTNVSLKYSIGDTDESSEESKNGQGIKEYQSTTDITNNPFRIYLDNLTRKGIKFTNDANTGVYVVTMTLTYYVSGEKVESKQTFSITLIPSSLYINVRNPQGLLYDTLEDLLEDIDNGVDGVPSKYISSGSYASFYSKIYEGSITTNKQSYDLTFNAYDEVTDSDSEYIFDDEPFETSILSGVTEQVETPKPISEPFGSPGIKMLVFSTYTKKETTSTLKSFVKYIYVKKSESKFKWYPDITMNNFYFRANQGVDTYSFGFPELSSGVQPLELSVSTSPITLTSPEWSKTSGEAFEATILSLGMQYSAVNEDNAKILEVFAPLSATGGYSDTPDYTLYSEQLFSDIANQKKISIPSESKYDKTINSQYHLIQIVRYKVGLDNNNNPQYASYLYVDGILESNSPTLDTNAWYIGKIKLNNVNVSYNLINIQSIKTDNINMDGLIYQYNLKYRESMKGETISDADKVMLENIGNIKFDGTNVLINDIGYVKTISKFMPIPTMMISYTPTDINEFKDALFRGYPNGDTGAFGTRTIDLWWCDGKKDDITTPLELHQVTIPEIDGLTGEWQLDLQGTSTMRNRIKNFSLTLKTKNTSTDSKDQLLVSPNFDSNDPHSFLPEQVWTIKADIADSAHANNTAIGKFVNRTCTTFSTGENISSSIKPYIKNTLEGFPVMLFFQIGQDVYYFGVYNFNMGRSSYYNLGYNTAEDTTNMFSNIRKGSTGDTFYYSKGVCENIKTLAIGEIQDNFAEFDFHQFDDTVLFQDDNSTITKMFGKDSKITGATKSAAKTTLSNFVKSVAKAGAYCFANIGKEPISSKADTGTDCVDRYVVINQVPDIAHQFKYEGNTKIWYDQTDVTFDNVKGNIDNLLQCISDYLIVSDKENSPSLDYTSAAEYYTICMAFGLVDSILKNMNIKSWDGKKCYIAFYDMDCANGENNAGGEDVSYLAATDYWYSDTSNGYIEPVDICWDYWDETVGKGFDFKSSYLFAVVKYAQALLNNIDDTKDIKLTHYPQEFWASLRKKGGYLQSAEDFINNFFISGIGKIPTYMASLDYQVKYLYKGTILDDNGEETGESFLANNLAFNGSRIEKVKIWLNRRFHFLDAMFNVQGIGIKIYSGVSVPIPNNISDLSTNEDITILTDVFSTAQNAKILSGNNALPVSIKAPKNTPFIFNNGGSYFMYLLCAETGENNVVHITTTKDVATRFLGSKEFTNINMIEPFFTDARQIVSNNLEEVIYGETTMPPKDIEFSIVSTSVKNIQMNIPTFSGKLIINNKDLNGQAVHTLNVKNSGFYGEWKSLKNLQNLNISSVSNEKQSVVIADCPKLKGNNCVISGRDQENLTTLNKLDMSGISGDFILNNTAIQFIDMTVSPNEDATFEIDGDKSLKELSLQGFSSVVIKNCPSLTTLKISDTEKNKCKKIIIDVVADDNGKINLTNLNLTDNDIENNKDYIFDFTTYTELEVLGLTGCKVAELIRIPDRKVSVTSFMNNENLEFIDTLGFNSVIELTKNDTFYMCPRYAMRQSWGLTANKLIRTRMCVSPECTNLSNTFNKGIYGSSQYKDKTYKNALNQNVYNTVISIQDAAWFLDDVVGGGKLDGSYVDDSGNIVDPDGRASSMKNKSYGSDVRDKIKYLNGCFLMQDGIIYNGSSSTTVPQLSNYKNLTDIAAMYKNTKVTYLDSRILDLPEEKNNNESPLIEWSEFVKFGEINVDKYALKNISYRIKDLNTMTFTIKGKPKSDSNADKKTAYQNKWGETEDDRIDILDVLCPKKYEEEGGEEGVDWILINGEKYEVIKRLTTISSFNIDSTQYVDYVRIFDLCPNINYLSYFLNCDLSKAKLAYEGKGMLKNCTKLSAVIESFNHNGSVNDLDPIDLYDFFNWGENTNMYALFSSNETTSNVPGFVLKKTVSNEHFNDIINSLSKYQNLTKLTNIFSYCTIKGYDNTNDITLADDMLKVNSINALFFKCKGETLNDDNSNIPLNIGRSFFNHLPNVQSVANTFSGITIKNMLTYDFFHKRRSTTNEVFVYVGEGENPYEKATLTTFNYGSATLNNMYNCFKDSKFYQCECWFNEDDENNKSIKPVKDTVIGKGTISNGISYDTYYTYIGGKYVENKITDPVAVSDTKNNFTNYVKEITVSNEGTSLTINNHDILSDLTLYKNVNEGSTSLVVCEENNFNIYKTHCCVPPDIFHACYYNCDLTGAFANTNIVGVIPQHLMMKCTSGLMKDVLLNTNILPNVIYHYDKKLEGNAEYLELINEIPIDNDTIMYKERSEDTDYILNESGNATVLFRNSDGILMRRYPVMNGTSIGEYSKSQFTYVPQGFTSTTTTTFDRVFTFRYNLPRQVDLTYDTLYIEFGIEWAKGNYDSLYSPENKPELWPYYTQYFFMSDESITWKSIKSMMYPFISDGYDTDFDTKSYENSNTSPNRIFSTSVPDGKFNTWCNEKINIDRDSWTLKTNGVFNVFLNLCGKRDKRTGILNDSGCLISESINQKNNPKLDSFVSGILSIFLNGKVFDDNLDAVRLTSINKSGANIILLNGFIRNIILPKLLSLQKEDVDSKVIMEFNPEQTYLYDFTFPDGVSKNNYFDRYIKEKKYIPTSCGGETITKFKVM